MVKLAGQFVDLYWLIRPDFMEKRLYSILPLSTGTNRCGKASHINCGLNMPSLSGQSLEGEVFFLI